MPITVPGQSNTGYRHSYSGTDGRVVAYFPGRGDKTALLESVHTISWSVHEAKGMVRSMGYRGVRGFSRGVRTIAGSMIMTVIEDNPFAPIMDVMAEIYLDPALRWHGWSMDWRDVGVGSGIDSTDFSRRLVPTMPPMNIQVTLVAEGAQWSTGPGATEDISVTTIPGAAYLLEGVEFIDEGNVVSVSDSATEMSYSFIAMNVRTLSKQRFQNVGADPASLDPGLALAAEVQKTITSSRAAQQEQYKSQTNIVDGIGEGLLPR